MDRHRDDSSPFLQSKSDRIFVLALLAVIVAVYSPALGAYFSADDFSFLRYLLFETPAILSGEKLYEWLFGGIVNYSVFRPMAHVYWLLNYVAFGLDPLGYHVTAILFHFIASFSVLILAYLLTHNRAIAAGSALVFAVMSVHAEAVSWLATYDLASAIYFFPSLIFYVLYRQRGAVRFYWFAFGAFVLSLAAREMGLMIPVLMGLYDLIYHPRLLTRPFRLILEYIPLGIVLAVRMLFFGHGYRGLAVAPEGWEYYVDFNLVRVFDPLVDNPGGIREIAFALAVALIVLFRFRPAASFGLLWIPIAAIPTTVGGINDHSFYIPSFGLALLLAMIFGWFFERKTRFARRLGLVLLLALIVGYSVSLFQRNETFVRASQVAQSILNRVKELHPSVPEDARLVFVGVPDAVREGPLVFAAGFNEALAILYKNPQLRVYKASAFPIWLDNLEHTYFFLVDHRRVTERTDLIDALEARKRCANFSQTSISWDVSVAPQGWEPWNDLEALENRNGSLWMRSVGNDPVLGGPEIDIPSIAVGDVEITMSVRGERQTFEGEVHWMASGQSDFTPGQKVSFAGQADGEFRTYRVDIVGSGTLLLGSRIIRLRIDPTAEPAEIAVRSIRVNTYCSPAGAE